MAFKEYLEQEPIFTVVGNEDNGTALANNLGVFDIPVRLFLLPKDLLEGFRSEVPSVVVLPARMNGMSASEVTATVRKISLVVPIVVLAASSEQELAAQCLRSGASEICDRPEDFEKIQSIVKRYLSQRAEFLKAEKAELESLVESFVEESLLSFKDIDQMILSLESKPLDRTMVDGLFRKIHSVKGVAGTFPSGAVIAKLSHDFETALDLIRKGKIEPTAAMIDLFLAAADMMIQLLGHMKDRSNPDKETVDTVEVMIFQFKGLKTISAGEVSPKVSAQSEVLAKVAKKAEEREEDHGIVVSNEALDSFLKLSGEMMMVKNYVQVLFKDPEIYVNPALLDKKFDEMIRGFNRITDSLQRQIMELRQVALDRIFSKLPRTVRTASQELGKKVKITIAGGDIGVDKNIAKDLSSALNHMVRNSIDHGIETPEVRQSLNKSEEGEIRIEASEIGGVIQIIIEDNGKGLDREKILAKAVERGMVTAEEGRRLTDSQVFEFIFMAGVSTAQTVTAISGRGVGMDVVRSVVVSYGGRIHISSIPGQGTKFTISIPASKSVLVESTVLVQDRDMIFAAPLTEIAQISTTRELVLSHINEVRYFQFNKRTVPLFTYSELVQGKCTLAGEELHNKSVLVLQHKQKFLGLLIDRIEGQLDAVVLPFDHIVKGLPGFKGTTLLGGAGIAYIMSSQQMVSLCDEPVLSALPSTAIQREAA